MTDLERLRAALSHSYRIERELGAGGMATVYLAHDLTHDRQVAVKVLKPELGAVLGAERFLSDIRVTANLQHPNLLPLFDSGAAGGLLYYVMPYIDGETLRARMEREGLLPVDEVTRLVTLLAGALDYAHARGVIHRDLKPENILLHAGQPVIADFGIALAVQHAGGERVTQTGLSLGTPQYMSPEQAAGDRAVDARSDQYALGAVTYEMLTGEPPHTGATAQVIIARLMSETPRSMRTVRPSVSAVLDEAVHRALSKTPADRFASCGDFARAIVTAATSTATTSGLSPGSRFGLIAFGVILAALTVLGTVVWLTVRKNRPASSSRPAIGRTTQVTRDPRRELDPARSRDGAMIAFARGAVTHMQICVQQMSGGRRVALTSGSTDDFRSPQCSPDRLTTGIEAHGIDRSKDGSHLAHASFRAFSIIRSMAVPRVGPVSVATARAVTTGYQAAEMLDGSADGRWLVSDSDRSGNADISRMPSTGAMSYHTASGVRTLPRSADPGRLIVDRARQRSDAMRRDLPDRGQ